MNRKSGKYEKYDAFFANNWRAQTVEEILKKPDELLKDIPTDERQNLYFTVADCFEEKGRKLKEQYVIPYDIDNLAGSSEEQVLANAELAAKACCDALGIHWEHTGILFSGNGVQLFVRMPKPILSEDYFDTMREHYKATCDRIQSLLVERSIQGKVDTSVFSTGRLMRMPNTWNRKPDKPTRCARVLQSDLVPQDFELSKVSGVSEIQKADQLHPDILKRYPTPDTKAVLEECGFLRWGFERPDEVDEPAWYAQLSIVSRLEKGEDLCHDMSSKAKSYNHYETETKIQQARNYGPRTCKDINARWDSCKKCPHWGTDLKSPIMIHGPDYIKSKDSGFREIRVNKETGVVTRGRVVYEDIIREYAKEPYIVSSDSKTLYKFKASHWEEVKPLEFEAWGDTKISPKADTREAHELYRRILRTNHRSDTWFVHSVKNKMNFKNCVLDLETLERLPHAPEFGFTHVLPYDYDPTAQCPKFDKFMLDITSGDQKLVQLLEEFAGYSLLSSDCRAQKALLMVGEGANGKSVFAEILQKAAGMGNFSAVKVNQFGDDQKIARLHRKLFNLCDEANPTALQKSEAFKELVSGAIVTGKVVYKEPFEFVNTTKLIVLCNEMPSTIDTSHGFFRRIIPVPFRQRFEGATDNKNLRYELEAELPGIYNRYVFGVQRLRARNFIFDLPVVVERLFETYKIDNRSAISQFCEEHILEAHGEFSTNHELFAEYASWARSTEERPVDIRRFMKDLRRELAYTSAVFDSNKRLSGRNHKGVENLKIINPLGATNEF